MITNSSAVVVSRHDYMPFGEELGAGVGGRTTAIGFSNSGNNNRKKFTGYERDTETGLDFAQARYFSSTQGRFTSPDPLLGSLGNPQSLNRYAYVGNNPLNFSDPTGHARFDASSSTGGDQGGYMSPDNPDFPIGLPQRYEDEIARIKELVAEDEAASKPPTVTEEEALALNEQILGAAPQNSSGQKRECPDYPQPPPEADLNANIRTADARRKSMEQSLFYPGADATTIAMNHILWFRDQVKKGGPWDYNHSKLRTPEEIKSSIYDTFGNFHYGAVGAAAGFDQETLLRAAGYAQETSGDTKGGGGQSGGLVGVFTGVGAKAPYGDKPEDQEAIRMGYAYYQKGCYKQ